MRPLKRILFALSISVTVVSATLASGAPAQAGVTSRVTTLAPGLTLTRLSDPSGPFQIRVLTIDPSKAVMIDVALSARTFGSFARTSAIASAHGAIAAVNGDFGMWPARPVHPFAKGGTLVATGDPAASFAISRNEQHVFAARVRPTIKALVPASGQTFGVDSWNTGRPGVGQIAGYTPSGGSVATPPPLACSARLAIDGKMRWGTGQTGVARDYTVMTEACRPAPMALNAGDVVLAAADAGGSASGAIKALVPGTVVTLTWSMGWADVATTIGGMPLLVQNRKVVQNVYCAGDFCGANPRTGIGYTAAGKVLLVTVDGRRAGWSVGMTMSRFAREMIQLGAVNAVNLDGGGSTTMWVKGFGLVNRPSDWSGERSVSSAVLVLPTTRTNPVILGGALAQVVGPSARATWQLMTSDPGSTGGLMEALTSGALGPASWLSQQDTHIARPFRSSAPAALPSRG